MVITLSDIHSIRDKKFIGGWEEGNDVFLWYRENGERKIINILDVPRYFCIRREDFNKIDRKRWQNYKDRGLYDKGVIKGNYAYIYTSKNWNKTVWNGWLTELDNLGITPLEGDVSRVQRLMVDNQLKVANLSDNGFAPKIAFYDIETDDRNDKIVIGENLILSVAWKDGQSGEEFFLYAQEATERAEKELLIEVYKQLVQYDILIGYNNYNFDDAYFQARLDYHNIDKSKWRRISTLDIYNLLERQGTFRKYDVRNRKLDTIAKAVLSKGKIEHSESIYDLWTNNLEKLKEYNLEDVRLIYEMEKILQTASLVISVSSYAGLLHSIGYSPAKTVDTYLLRHAANRRKSGGFDYRYATGYYRPEHNTGKYSSFTRNALPSDKRKGRKEILEEEFGIEYEPVQGAIVMEAEPGLYENVHAFDFNSLYPNTIRAFNIGHDTLVSENFDGPKNMAPNGVFYRTDIISGMSESVTRLIDERKRVRAQLELEDELIRKMALDVTQRAIKELTNSFYGVTAQYGGRYYSKEIAESITSSGRTFLPFGDEYLSSRGHKVVIGDTDSLYVAVKPEINPQNVMDDYLKSLYEMLINKYNIYRPEYLKMSYERRMDRVLIVAKKLYSCWVTMEDGKDIDGKLVSKGLMFLKGNYPKWATDVCKEVLQDLLSGKFKNADHYIRIIEREKRKICNGELDYKNLLVSARIGKPLTEYVNENALAHIRVARRLAEKGQHIPPYSVISYLVIDGDKSPIDAIDDSEVNNETVYDGAYYFNNYLMSQLESLLSPVFPQINWKEYRFPKNKKRAPFSLKIKVNHANI